MKRPLRLLLACFAAVGCSSSTTLPGSGGNDGVGGSGAGGQGGGSAGTTLSCPGSLPAPSSSVISLFGFVRTLADPTALQTTPNAQVDVYAPDGAMLATAFADNGMDGRVLQAVPISNEGFSGYAVITASDFLDYRLQVNRPITRPDMWAFVWLVTQAEVDSWGASLGLTQAADNGILIGTAHDCDGFGMSEVVVEVDGSSESVRYVDGPRLNDHPTDSHDCLTNNNCSHPFAPLPQRSATDVTGRFLVANVKPGTVVVEAFGRLQDGGPVGRIATMQTEVEAGRITAVALHPPFAN